MSVLSSSGARYLPAAIYPKIREYGIVAPWRVLTRLRIGQVRGER